MPPVGRSKDDPQLLQPIAKFLIAPGFAGLLADGSQPSLDFVDNVGKTEQVLFDALQTPQSFDLFGLEAADARRFFEDHAAIARRSLQQHIDFALLDDAVGLGGGAGAGKQIADIAQPARLAIDEVFTLAAAIDPARDVDLSGVDRQLAVGIVEDERRLGGIQAAAVRPSR